MDEESDDESNDERYDYEEEAAKRVTDCGRGNLSLQNLRTQRRSSRPTFPHLVSSATLEPTWPTGFPYSPSNRPHGMHWFPVLFILAVIANSN